MAVKAIPFLTSHLCVCFQRCGCFQSLVHRVRTWWPWVSVHGCQLTSAGWEMPNLTDASFSHHKEIWITNFNQETKHFLVLLSFYVLSYTFSFRKNMIKSNIWIETVEFYITFSLKDLNFTSLKKVNKSIKCNFKGGGGCSFTWIIRNRVWLDFTTWAALSCPRKSALVPHCCPCQVINLSICLWNGKIFV